MKKERLIIWVIIIIGIIIIIFYVMRSSSSNISSQAPSLLSGSPASDSLSYNPNLLGKSIGPECSPGITIGQCGSISYKPTTSSIIGCAEGLCG